MKNVKKLVSIFLILMFLVTVVPISVQAATTTMKLNKESISMTVGKTSTLKVTTNKEASNIKWKTSDKKIVSISQNGKKVTLTAKKAGTVTITCQIGSKKQTCQVTTTEPIMKLNKTKATMKILTNLTLNVTTDKNASDVIWSTSNDKVVTIKQDGKNVTLTAKKSGTATITCQIGNEKETCKITIKKKSEVKSYTKDEVIAIVRNTLENGGIQYYPDTAEYKRGMELVKIGYCEDAGPSGGMGWAEIELSMTDPYTDAKLLLDGYKYDKNKYYYLKYLRRENGKYVIKAYFG